MRRSVLLSLLLFSASLLQAQEPTPAIPPELGGPGFEKIAAADGWRTGDLSDEDLNYLADPNALKGEEIRVGISDYPATFRAYGKDENDQTTRLICGLVYEPLINVNPLTLEFLPGLASHWKVGEDGQTYWFRIDPRARFADGTPVTTKDVIATYNLAVDPGILSPYTNYFYETFDSLEAVSPYLFKVGSKEKKWKNLLYFGGTSILPAHVIGELDGTEYLERYNYDMPTGSGPYQVLPERGERGRRITLVRREEWWHANDPLWRRQFNFDSITLLVTGEDRETLEDFKRGEIDICLVGRAQWWKEEFDFSDMKRGLVQKRKIFNDEPQGLSGLVFNMRRPPFDNPKIRKAFIALFDRRGLVEEMMYGEYLMVNSFFPGSVYENPGNPEAEFDPEKGKRLLAEAGYTKKDEEGVLVHEATGEPLKIEIPATLPMMRLLTPIAETWREAGIDVELREVDFATKFKLANERNFDLLWMNWGGLSYPNPRTSFHSDLADIPNTNNLAGFSNPVADSLMELELTTYDQEKRVKILRQLDSILVTSHQYALGWYAPFTRVAYWNRFGHPEFYIGRTSDWQSILALWWYDPAKAATLEQALDDPSITMPVGDEEIYFWEEYDAGKDAYRY